MIHASKELVDGMRGVVDQLRHDDVEAECGAITTNHYGSTIWGWNGFQSEADLASGTSLTDIRRVDCPACLILMRAATCPARWDHLETLGLAPKLEAK